MNTIKFTHINGISTERHDPYQEKTMITKYFGKDIELLVPTNLNILISYLCDCDCDFCIIKQNEKLKEIQDADYLLKLSGIFEKLKGLPIEITITGGEPTLSPERLIPILKLIKKYGFKHRTFSTNGVGLLNNYDGKVLLQHMKENGARYNINLSRMHPDGNVNDRLMNGNSIPIADIKQIASFCSVNDMDFRISCNLMKHGICDINNLLEYITFAEICGIQNIIFRELVNWKSEFVDIKSMMKKIKENNQFYYLETVESNQYRIEIYRYLNYIVKLYEQKQGKPDVVTNLVFREGTLSESWNTNTYLEV